MLLLALNVALITGPPAAGSLCSPTQSPSNRNRVALVPGSSNSRKPQFHELQAARPNFPPTAGVCFGRAVAAVAGRAIPDVLAPLLCFVKLPRRLLVLWCTAKILLDVSDNAANGWRYLRLFLDLGCSSNAMSSATGRATPAFLAVPMRPLG